MSPPEIVCKDNKLLRQNPLLVIPDLYNTPELALN